MSNLDRLESDRTLSELVDAEILENRSRSYFVEYSDGTTAIEPATTKNSALFEADAGLLEANDFLLTFHGEAFPDGSGDDSLLDPASAAVRLDLDLTAETVQLTVGSERVDLLPSERGPVFEDVFDLLANDNVGTDTVELPTTLANRLFDIYTEVVADRIRPERIAPIIDALPATFDADRLEARIGNVRVTDDASNYLVDEMESYTPTGTLLDDDHQLVTLSIPTSTEAVFDILGTEYTLSAREQEFLVTLLILSYPSEFIGVDGFQARAIGSIKNATGAASQFAGLATKAHETSVQAFKDPVSGLVHKHGLGKHTIAATYSVASWVIDEMHFTQYDHAALHELSHREDTFRADPRDVFFDAPSASQRAERWTAINSTKSSAKVPDHVYRTLDELYR
jgi:hypothetical protein